MIGQNQAICFVLFFAMLLSDGVLAKPSDCFQVIADEGMRLKIKAGFGLIKGHFAYDNEEAEILISNAPNAYKRIDAVVLRLNNLNRLCEIIIKEGIPAAHPQMPELVRPASGDYYELCLAKIMIDTNQTSISQKDITDTRYDSRVCGVVTQLIDHLDTSVFLHNLTRFIKTLWKNQIKVMSSLDRWHKPCIRDLAQILVT